MYTRPYTARAVTHRVCTSSTVPHRAECTFQAQSGRIRLFRGDLSQTAELELAAESMTLEAKQPLCARQNAFRQLD